MVYNHFIKAGNPVYPQFFTELQRLGVEVRESSDNGQQGS